MPEKATARQINGPTGPSILLVDDHPVFITGMRELLETEGYAIQETLNSAEEAIKYLDKNTVELVITDLSMDGISGLELVKHLRNIDEKEPKILVCSMHDENVFAERALQNGANGFIQKSADPTELLSAIEKVAQGKTYMSDEINEKLVQRALSGQDTAQSPIETLSDRELEVFEAIGHGKTTKAIAEELILSPKTIETYRQNIKNKLGLDNTSELPVRAAHWVMQASKGAE